MVGASRSPQGGCYERISGSGCDRYARPTHTLTATGMCSSDELANVNGSIITIGQQCINERLAP